MSTADADTEFLASIDSFLASFGLPVFSSIQELFGNDGGEESKTTGAIERSAEAPAKTDSAGPETYAMQSRDETEVQTSADVATKYESLKAMDRKRRNVYRAQKQVEREDLRQQVVELTAELAERQKIAGINNLPPASAWKMVAQLRFQKRLRAEAQRHRLSEAVDARAALVHEFQEFMQQRIAGLSDVRSEDIMSEDSTGYQYERIRLEPSDDEIFRASAQELDIIYAQTDEVFRSCGLNSTDTGWRGCKKKWRENAEKGCFVYENTFVMPFDFQRFYASVWHVVRMPHRQEGRQTYEAVGDRDNTVAMKFRITTRLQSGRNVSVLRRVVSRRYEEKSRVVVVWKSFTEGEGMFTGLHADENGWSVANPVTNALGTETLIRACMHHVPMHFSRTTSHEDQFTGVLLEKGTEDIIAITNQLEILLLEGAL